MDFGPRGAPPRKNIKGVQGGEPLLLYFPTFLLYFPIRGGAPLEEALLLLYFPIGAGTPSFFLFEEL